MDNFIKVLKKECPRGLGVEDIVISPSSNPSFPFIQFLDEGGTKFTLSHHECQVMIFNVACNIKYICVNPYPILIEERVYNDVNKFQLFHDFLLNNGLMSTYHRAILHSKLADNVYIFPQYQISKEHVLPSTMVMTEIKWNKCDFMLENTKWKNWYNVCIEWRIHYAEKVFEKYIDMEK